MIKEESMYNIYKGCSPVTIYIVLLIFVNYTIQIKFFCELIMNDSFSLKYFDVGPWWPLSNLWSIFVLKIKWIKWSYKNLRNEYWYYM